MATTVSSTSFDESIHHKSNRPNTTVKNRIQCKQELIVAALQDFFSTPGHLDAILPILQGKSNVSLRLIDWFVTNYAKRHTIGYVLAGQEFMVYMSYHWQTLMNIQ